MVTSKVRGSNPLTEDLREVIWASLVHFSMEKSVYFPLFLTYGEKEMSVGQGSLK